MLDVILLMLVGRLLIRSKHDSSLEQMCATTYDILLQKEQKLSSRSCGGILDLKSHILGFIRLRIASLGHFLQVQVGIGSEQVFRIVNASIWCFLRHGDWDNDRFVH